MPKKLRDDICRYKDPETDFIHIKFCEEGKTCKPLSTSTRDSIYTCQNITTIIPLKTYEESCESDFECETGLYCKRGTLANKCSPLTSCGDGYKLYQYRDGSWDCRSNNNPGITLINSATSPFYASPGYLKVHGKLHVKEVTNKNYEVEKIEESDIGSVPNGDFVADELACESGFALYFYGNGELEDPYTGTGSSNGNMFKKCVSVDSIEITSSHECRITYDGGKIYNVWQLELGNNNKKDYTGDQIQLYDRSSSSSSSSGLSLTPYYYELCQEHLVTKLEMFKRYKDRLKEKLDNCTFKDNYNEPETCNDDILRKWYHFYKNPEDYLLYYDDEEEDNEIAKFLIQQDYNLYQFSGFLKIKYFIPLLFLFAL